MPTYFLVFSAVFLIILMSVRNTGVFYYIRKKRGQQKMLPASMINEFIGKTVTIILFNDSFGVSGTIVSVEDNWVKVEEKNGYRIINGDMIRDIFVKKQR